MISRFSPVSKFLSVKTIVFMTYWQGLAVASIPGLKPEWNDWVLCVEMLFLGFFTFLGSVQRTLCTMSQFQRPARAQ